jgi:hypothetical protein
MTALSRIKEHPIKGSSRGTQGVPAWMQKAFSRMSGQISLSDDGLVESRLEVPVVHAIRSSTVTCVH